MLKKYYLMKQMMIMKIVKTPGMDNDEIENGDISIAYNKNSSMHQ